MTGCYGNCAEDRYFSRQLDKYLNEQEDLYNEDEIDPFCETCGEEIENCNC